MSVKGSSILSRKRRSSGSDNAIRQPPVIVILGATGTGKSKLSVDIATRIPGAEIVNTDKMQFYRGLDIVTNKLPLTSRCGVPHHLIDELDAADGELSASDFRSRAAELVDSILGRGGVPILAGGSSTYIHALLVETFDPNHDPFVRGSDPVTRLGYECCFLWVDVSADVLEEYLDMRVDEMVEKGLVGELAEHYNEERAREGRYVGVDRSIGVPEFDRFFLRFPPSEGCGREGEREAMEGAVREMKENTRRLARRQVEKLRRLAEIGWDVKRLDTTEAVRRKLEGKAEEEEWADVVVRALEEVERVVGGEGGGGGKRKRGSEEGGSPAPVVPETVVVQESVE